MTDLDFSARYECAQFPGIAFRLVEYFEQEVQHEVPEGYDNDGMPLYSYYYDKETDYDRVIAVMVGDDYRHIIEVEDLTKLDEDAYCDN